MRRPFAFAAPCAALVLSLVIGAPGGAQPGKKANEKPARVVVYLPEDAALYVEGSLCPLKSERRAFSTAPLEPGKRYEYTLRAEVTTKNDAKVGVTLTALVRAGETTEVRFGDESSFLAAGGLGKPDAKPKDKEPEPNPAPKGGPLRLPTAPAPWAVAARIDGDGDLAYTLPGDRDTRYVPVDTFAVFTADGKELTPRAARERLTRETMLFVAADAKPLDPFYASFLVANAFVVVPKKDLPAELASAPRSVQFGLASASDGTLRVRFPDATASRTRDEQNAQFPGRRVRVSRGTASEQVLDVPLSAARGFGAKGPIATDDLELALATEGPVVLLERGRAPGASLTTVLKPGTRVLSLPVPFRDP